MGIYKKDDGYYILDKTIEGERFRKSLRTKNIKQARKRAKVIEKRWYEERYNPKPKSKKPSQKKLIRLFFREKHFNTKGTKRAYKEAVKTMKKLDNCNENSKRYVWRHLKAIYNWGIKQGYVDDNPYEKFPSNTKPTIDYYTDSEVNEILDNLGSKKVDDIIRFAFQTGARRGELVNLSPDDVNEHNIVLEGKSGRRPFPINNKIRELLERGKVYGYKTPSALSTALKKKNVSATKIRHTFATRLVKNGMDLYRVAKLMGHKSVKTTEKYYAHLKPTDIEDYGDYLGY